jgi:hypothetical protein
VCFLIKLIDKYKKNELNNKIKKIIKKLNEWSDTYRWYEPKKCIKRHLWTKKLGEYGWLEEDELMREWGWNETRKWRRNEG